MTAIYFLEGLLTFYLLFLGDSSLSAQPDPSCPLDWRQFSSSCYLMLDTILKWQEGRDACEALGARLVEITSDEENQFIVDLVDNVTFTSVDKAWLDCTNIGRSLNDWVCGADDHELSYDNWKLDEPNNFDKENCLEIYLSGVWNDKKCNEERLVICKKSLQRPISKSIYMKRDGSWPPRCLHNHMIKTVQSASLVACVSRCLATGESCLSLNYYETSTVCQLNDADESSAPGDFLETENCKYFRIVA